MDATTLEDDYDYPESDGRPMAESTVHWKVMVDTTQSLERRYAKTPDVWVGSNLFLYYKPRQPGIAPDVLAVRGVAKEDRRTFKVWEEGQVPFFVLEATSEETREEDEEKKEIYREIGVEEFFLFDPMSEYLNPRLQGFRLSAKEYLPIPRSADGSLQSRTTGLLLRGEGLRLRLVDTATGKALLWMEEIVAEVEAFRREHLAQAARQAAEERADRDAAACRVLEEEIARLRAELGRRQDG